MMFSRPPTKKAMAIIIPVDFIKSFRPSSLNNTTNVATQGKYMASTTLAIISCFMVKPRGSNMPMATSFLKKPITKDAAASFGSPSIPTIIGAVILVIMPIGGWLIFPRPIISETLKLRKKLDS